MSTGKEEVEADDDFVVSDAEESTESPVEVAKTNLTKRRTIDNYLEDLRLRRQLADYDFDL